MATPIAGISRASPRVPPELRPPTRRSAEQGEAGNRRSSRISRPLPS